MLAESANNLIEGFLEKLRSGEKSHAMDFVSTGIEHYPSDGRFYVCLATLVQANGDANQAFSLLWRALITDPGNTFFRDEIRHAVLAGQSLSSAPLKDFSLNSGERQVAEHIAQIRIDHRLRYQMAANWIRRKFGSESRNKIGLDLFSGNGYGSSIIADQSGAKMFGIDGSTEAVELAERAYGTHRVVFGQAIHPFDINFTGFDFIVSLELIEHVEQPEKLLQQMARATEGPFIISFPDEAGLPFNIFSEKFEHHIKHYTRNEMLELLSSVGRKKIISEYGQNVYHIENNNMVGLLPENEMALFHPIKTPQFRIMVVEAE